MDLRRLAEARRRVAMHDSESLHPAEFQITPSGRNRHDLISLSILSLFFIFLLRSFLVSREYFFFFPACSLYIGLCNINYVCTCNSLYTFSAMYFIHSLRLTLIDYIYFFSSLSLSSDVIKIVTNQSYIYTYGVGAVPL